MIINIATNNHFCVNKFPAKLVYNSKIFFSSTSPPLQKSAEEDCCPDVDFSQIFKTFPIACGFDRKCLRSILCAYISKPRHYCQIFTKHCKSKKNSLGCQYKWIISLYVNSFHEISDNWQILKTRSSKDECSTGSNNHLRSTDLFRS